MSRKRHPTRTEHRQHGPLMRGMVWLTLGCFLAGPAGASGEATALGNVATIYGQGQITTNTSTHTVYDQSSSVVSLSWDTDIQQPADHHLEFEQSRSDTAINYMPGVTAANFYGTVTGEGRLVFVNRAGIHFQDGAFVDTGELIAVGGDIAASDFDKGRLHILNNVGDVTNHGEIHADAVILAGARVANFGEIHVDAGSLVMVAGDEIWLREHDSPVFIQAPRPADGVSDGLPAVENTGRIFAGNGRVRLAAGDMLSYAIHAGGTIQARQIDLEGGEGGLVSVSGTLDARGLGQGETGGEVEVGGDYVVLEDGALIDASGDSGGGRVHVGGDVQGGGDMRTSKGTFVDENAVIRADAIGEGDGGEVVVWSDGTSQVYGQIFARGGQLGGNGGFAETSGKLWLDVDTLPQLGARSGRSEDHAGSWLIDPNNIEIIDGDCTDSDTACLDSALDEDRRANPTFVTIDQTTGTRIVSPQIGPTVDDSQLSDALLAEALSEGLNVTVTTRTLSTSPGTQDGNITISGQVDIDDTDAVDPSTRATLTLLASRDIIVKTGGAIRNTNDNLDLNIQLVANDTTQPANPSPTSETPAEFQGDLILEAGSELASGGGHILLSGANIDQADGSTISTGGGAFTALAQRFDGFGWEGRGDVTLDGKIDTTSELTLRGEDPEGVVRGGNVEIRARAIQRPETGEPGSPLEIVGGNIRLGANATITTDGGEQVLAAEGGDLQILGGLDSSKKGAVGGNVQLIASPLLFGPNDPNDPSGSNILSDGAIRLGDGSTGSIKTGGGTASIGETVPGTVTWTTEQFAGPPPDSTGAERIFIRGDIDTRRVGENGLLDEEAVGGSIVLRQAGDTGRVVVADGAILTTNGGGFFSSKRTNAAGVPGIAGTFDVIDATIDTRYEFDGGADASGLIDIEAAGDITIAGNSALRADDLVKVWAGTSGRGDLAIDSSGTLGAPLTIGARQISLGAGDGAQTASGLVDARVVIDATNLAFEGETIEDPNAPGTPLTLRPERFSLRQDADLGQADMIALTSLVDPGLAPDFGVIQDLLAPGVSPDLMGEAMIYELESSDGSITLDDFSQFEGADLRLRAASDLDVVGAVPAGNLDALQIQVLDDFTVDDALAQRLGAATADLSIEAGRLDTELQSIAQAVANLTIEGDLDAADRLALHAGAGGDGVLAFGAAGGGDVKLTSNDILLSAGDGLGGAATAEVRAQSGVVFERSSSTERLAFALHQDASVDDTTVPLFAQFYDDVGGNVGIAAAEQIEYELRSSDGGIVLKDAVDQLADTRLSLHAIQPIDLARDLAVRSLDIGGLADFTYTKALADRIRFTTPDDSRMILRAGLNRGTPGVLGFGADVVVEADEIRLVASDGLGGVASTSQPDQVSRIVLDPAGDGAGPIFRKPAVSSSTTPFKFVFRQDSIITEGELPSLAEHFEGQLPDEYFVRSDLATGEAGIAFSLFDGSTDRLPGAKDRLVLWAPIIDLTRVDGPDLDLTQAFGLDVNGGLELELRASNLNLNVSGESTSPIFTPGAQASSIYYTDLIDDVPEGETAPPLPRLLDLVGDQIEIAPDVITLTQDGTIADASLIDPGQLGCPGCAATTLKGLQLSSLEGSIELTPEKVEKASLVAEVWTEGAQILFNESLTLAVDPRTFDLTSLDARSQFAWEVGTRVGTTEDLLLIARDGLSLRSGLDNALQANRDLSFASGVTLRSQVINLQAGLDPTEAGVATLPALTPARIDAATNGPSFELIGLDEDGEDIQSVFSFYQQGDILDDAARTALLGAGSTHPILPAPTQFSVVDATGAPVSGALPEGSIDIARFTSQLGDIQIHDFLDVGGLPKALPGREIDLTANDELATGEARIVLGEQGQDLDLAGLFTSGELDRMNLQAEDIELQVTGAGEINAQADRLFFFGLESFAPSRFVFRMQDSIDDAFDPAAPSTPCVGTCLPGAAQFLSPVGVDYVVESTGGTVRLDQAMAEKVWASDLTLLANTSLTGPHVTIDINPTRRIDIILNSLTIGDAAADPNVMLTRIVSDSSTDPARIVTIEGQEYNSNLEISESVELTGQTIRVAGKVDRSAAATPASLIVNPLVRAIFEDDIGTGSAGPLDLLRVNFEARPTNGERASVQFGSSDPADLDTLVAANTIEFFSQEFVGKETPLPRSNTNASIYRAIPDDMAYGTLVFRADEFRVSQGEKISVAGSLVIEGIGSTPGTPLAAGSVTVGDLSALDIRIDTDVLDLVRRPGGPYVRADGRTAGDGGVELVANTIDLSFSSLTLSGQGKRPIIGVLDTVDPPDALFGFAIVGLNTARVPLRVEDFIGASVELLDLHPEGPSVNDTTSDFFGAEVVPVPAAWVGDGWLVDDESMLAKLELVSRPTRPAEYVSRMEGAGILDDVGMGVRPPGTEALRVAESRLLGRGAQRAVRLYEKLFGEQGERAPEVKAILQEALDGYVQAMSPRRVVGFLFRQYIKNRPSSQFLAHQTLEDLDSLLANHRRLGLAPGEYRAIQMRWLAQVKPDGISLDELAQAIHPSHFVRGTDVLDIFGE